MLVRIFAFVAALIFLGCMLTFGECYRQADHLLLVTGETYLIVDTIVFFVLMVAATCFFLASLFVVFENKDPKPLFTFEEPKFKCFVSREPG